MPQADEAAFLIRRDNALHDPLVAGTGNDGNIEQCPADGEDWVVNFRSQFTSAHMAADHIWPATPRAPHR
jgi:hypothetical protein